MPAQPALALGLCELAILLPRFLLALSVTLGTPRLVLRSQRSTTKGMSRFRMCRQSNSVSDPRL